MMEEMKRLDIIPAAFIPFENLIQLYDFERKPLLDLPDDSISVTAIDELMTEVLSR